MAINELNPNLFSNVDAENELGEMAAKVALQNFDYRFATLIFFNSSLYYGVDLFLRAFNKNIILNRGIFNSNITKVTHQYVIFVSDVIELEQLLERLRELQMINTGKFIFICQSSIHNDCNENDIIELFWEYRIFYVVLIKLKEVKAHGYTYYPVSDDVCYNLKPIKLNSFNHSQYITGYGNIFNNKFKKLNFCPLYVSTFIQSPYMNITNGIPFGPDGDLLRIIAYGLNTSVVMMTPHRADGWGYLAKNGTWMGSLADIYEDLANMSMTSAALTPSRVNTFQYSDSYYTCTLIWMVHPAELQNEALKLMQPFETTTRIALIASYMFVILCAFVVKTDKWSSICRNKLENEPTKSVVFYSWMICMGQPIVKLPTKSVLLHITFLWIYFCFMIRNAYQVYLISSLKGKFYEEQFNSIEDAIRAKYPFGGGAALQDYYLDNPDIHDNWITVATSEIIPTAMEISRGKQFALAMNLDTAMVVIKKHKVSLHILPEKIMSGPNAIFFKKYSPLVESINIILGQLCASGFPEKLHKDYTTSLPIQQVEDQETLKMVHFTACYVILIIGWILSVLFFLLEVYFGKIYKHPLFSP